jgi:hypothetical protein
MIRFEGGFFLLLLALDVFCVIDLIQTRDDEVRNLPKIAWLILILLFPPIGSIAWLVAGRPQAGARRPAPYERSASAFPEYDRPGRAAGTTAESDEEFLRKIRERAEEQRRKAAEDKLRREAEGEGPTS